MAPTARRLLLRSIRLWLCLFTAGLILSGLTAFPLQTETSTLVRWARTSGLEHAAPSLFSWLQRVGTGLAETNARFPFIAYGTDWLAFAHLVIALAFIGPWRDPVRNCWVIDFGLLACLSVVPLALIAGPLKGIPLFWRLIDCSFGVLGALPLWRARVLTRELALREGHP